MDITRNDVLNLIITSNINSFESWRRFPSSMSLKELKLLTGVCVNDMNLELYESEGNFLKKIEADNVILSSLGIKNGMRIHVINPFHCSEDLKEVYTSQHYQFSSEEYKKKNDTVRSFLIQNKLGKYNKELMDKLKSNKKNLLEEEIKLTNEIKIGDRCEIVIPGYPNRRGYVHFKDGPWVGVQYDEPLGKNDGSIDGKKYFECPFKYGAFVRPSSVSVGEYPELSEDIDEI